MLSFELTTRALRKLANDIDNDSQTGGFTKAIRGKRFSAGVPVSYVLPEAPQNLVREYPDGRIVKESLAEREKKMAWLNHTWRSSQVLTAPEKPHFIDATHTSTHSILSMPMMAIDLLRTTPCSITFRRNATSCCFFAIVIT